MPAPAGSGVTRTHFAVGGPPRPLPACRIDRRHRTSRIRTTSATQSVTCERCRTTDAYYHRSRHTVIPPPYPLHGVPCGICGYPGTAWVPGVHVAHSGRRGCRLGEGTPTVNRAAHGPLGGPQ